MLSYLCFFVNISIEKYKNITNLSNKKAYSEYNSEQAIYYNCCSLIC